MLTPAQIAALKTELATDPTAIGYAPAIARGDDTATAALVNSMTNTNIFRDDITIHEVITNIASTDFANLTAIRSAKLQLLFTGTTTLDATSANTRSIAVGIFNGMATTAANLTALASRKGTRAEILFGIHVFVTANDVAATRG